MATINSNSLTTSEIRLVDLDDKAMLPKLFHRASAGVECFVDHIPGKFIVLSNHAAQNSTFRLHLVSEEGFLLGRDPRHWSEVSTPLDIPCGTMTDVEIFAVIRQAAC